MEFDDKFEEECYEKEVCSCDVKVSEESKTKKRGLLKRCDEINKQNDVSFISNIKFGSDAKRKSEEEYYHIIKQYSPAMKMVFRHKTYAKCPELLFNINMIKTISVEGL